MPSASRASYRIGVWFMRIRSIRALKQTVPLPVAIAFMIFVLLYFPCIATFVAIKNETGRWSWAWGICLYTIAIAWIFAWIGKEICQMLL